MRPINLIPKDERHVERSSLASGAFGWAIVAALTLGVIGVVVLATTSSSVAEREVEVANLEDREAEAKREAERLSPYIEFAAVSQGRTHTVATLAASRFGWERVMRELALLMPDDIVLESLTATVAPGVSVPGATSVGMRSEIEAPALEMTGCGVGARNESQEAVARFITRLYDMGGVTRVGVPSSQVGEGEGGDGACSAPGGQASSFELVAAFDHAPLPDEQTPLIQPEASPEGPDESESVPASEERDPTTAPEQGEGGTERQGSGATETPTTGD